jgi:hypothetical protein
MRILPWFCILAVTVTCGLRAADTTVRPAPDSSTVLRNPAMGFVTYTGCNKGQFDKPEWIFGNPRVLSHCNIIYLRTGWESLEPSEGNYAWKNNESFKAMIRGIRDQHCHLALRVIAQDGECAPKWVLAAVKAAGHNPMSVSNPKYPDVTNPVWQKKFESFILALGKAFDDPTLVDYIDANGLGIWGEGNMVGIATHEQEVAYYDWHVGLYARAFKHVLLSPTFCMMGANPLDTDERVTFGHHGTIFRLDGMGSQYPSDGQLAFINKIFPAAVLIGEKCYSFGDKNGWGGDPKIKAKAAPGAPTLQTYMGFVLDQAMAYHAMTLDFSEPEVWLDQNPELAARFVANIGYRLRPKEVVFPSVMPDDNEAMTISHTWCNDGTGALPNLNRNWLDPKTHKGKYRLAFALFLPGQEVPVKVTIDPLPEPGAWVKGSDSHYTSSIAWGVPRQAYDLGVAIVDTTRPRVPALDLAIKGLERRHGWHILGGLK